MATKSTDLLHELLSANPDDINTLKQMKFASHRMAKALGRDGTVDITLQELPGDKIREMQVNFADPNAKNSPDFGRMLSLFCVDGIVDPPVKNQDLVEHFKCGTPLELVNKLFGAEVVEISGALLELSGISAENEEEVKN